MANQTNINEEKKLKLPSLDLDTKKELAKIGMTASMGITVATSMYMKTKFMKRLHVVAGVALVGFSYWHHTLYQPAKKKAKKELPILEKVDDSDINLEVEPEEENLAISLNNFFVELSIKGKLTYKETEAFKNKIEELLVTYEVPSVNVLIDVRLLEKIELKALWDDILFTIKHIKEIKKVVVIGNNKLEEYSVNIAHKVVPFDMEYFDDYTLAKEWLLKG